MKLTLRDHIARRLRLRGLTKWAETTTIAEAIEQDPGELYVALAEACDAYRQENAGNE
ncbi:MAG TPA: hypothetical protein VMY35_05200 [Phycisphaerae bacterium]|nr:hypothetical protein [Phycisphaerae bacterium]